MENSIYIGLSRQLGLWKQLEMTANNLANANTPAFKQEQLMFAEFVKKADKTDDMSMVREVAKTRDFSQGRLESTGNQLDVAIEGEGFFRVKTAVGERYTRAGNFTISPQGTLATMNGDEVLNSGGSSITIPQNATEILISKDGTISTAQGTIGQLGVARFANPQALTKVSNNLYAAENTAPIPAEDARMLQGMLEGSNVEPILEINNMIKIQRYFEASQNLIDNEHERQLNAVRKLSGAN